MSKDKTTLAKIAIVGGYGSVGRIICETLTQELPAGSVVVVGRELAKAEELATKLGHGATALEVNAFDASSYSKLFIPEHNIKAVVSCIELPEDATLPKDILAHGINFTELSASYSSHQRLMQLESVAREHKATAVMGVGLMPGLSNVMAYDAASQLDQVTAVYINILLGLGEAHGLDAVRWTLRNIGSSYDIAYSDQTRHVQSFTEPYETTLLDEQKPRRFYRFNFSDQHMLNQALPSAHVDSRMAFDSRGITSVLGAAAKLRLLSLVKESAAPIFQKLVSTATVGSAMYAIQVEAIGVKQGRPMKEVILAKGEIEAKGTAMVAAYVGKRLLIGLPSGGVFPIEQFVNASELYGCVTQKGTTIDTRELPGR